MPNTVGEMYLNDAPEPDEDSNELTQKEANEILAILLEKDGFQGLCNPNGWCESGCKIDGIADECGGNVDIENCCPGIICEQSGKIIPGASPIENLTTVLTIISTK